MRLRTGDPEMAREINRALILDILRRKDLIPRADIARILKLSKVTVSAIIQCLIDEEFVIEIGEGDALKRGGRKPILLSLNHAGKYVIGIDIGYANTVVAIGNLKGKFLAKVRVPTVHDHSVENVVQQTVSVVEEIIHASQLVRSNILGIGLSVAGTVEKSKGIIVFSPDFKWRNVAIASILEQKTGLRTVADNCTRAMTRGEIWYGRAQEVRNLFYINIGYGIGSAIVVDEKIYENHCEGGHILITKRNVSCYCGKSGCLEAVASGQAIEQMANERIKHPQSWISAKMLADMARQGNAAARHIFAEAGRYIGRMTSIAANLFNPDKIIIGGGVALAGDLLLASILQEFQDNTMEGIKNHTQIEFSALGMDAGASGAISLALNAFIFQQELIHRADVQT